MPEGDTVHRTAARLDRALAGDLLEVGRLDVPRHAGADLAGARVEEVRPRGKHLLMRLTLGTQRLTLHTHLRMDGRWVLVPGDRSPYVVPRHEIRALLRTARWSAVGHLLGEVDLLRTEDEHRVVGHLGPDLLDDDVDLAAAQERLLAEPRAELGDALREQRNVAGLGNELVNEVCFLRGVTPWTPVAEVDLPALLDLARRVLRANATRAVRSTTGDLRTGRTSYVYGRAGRPCRRCRALVRSHPQGPREQQRTSWWCPSCQRGPAPRG